MWRGYLVRKKKLAKKSIKSDGKKNYLAEQNEPVSLPKNSSAVELETRPSYKFKSGAVYEG